MRVIGTVSYCFMLHEYREIYFHESGFTLIFMQHILNNPEQLGVHMI